MSDGRLPQKTDKEHVLVPQLTGPQEKPLKNVKFNRYLGLGQNKLLNMLLNHPVRIIFILSSFLPLCPLNLGYGDQNIYFTSTDVSIFVKPGVPYSSKNFSHSLGLQNQFEFA